MKNPWVKLNLALNSPLPSLYIKYDLTATSCRVILTDLAKLWSEDLSRAQILQRAIEIGTSIDPSEDREQLNVLLQKVQDALQNKEGTHLQLIAGDQDGVLQLKTLTQLPAPFQPLLWHFKLLPLEHVALTEELLLPLLQDHAGLSQDFRALISSLEEKDHVILKLLDKIEGSSVSLSDVFPSLRGGKKVLNRSVAESSISGLAGFDSKKFGWKSETARLLLERGDQRFSYMGDESASLHHAAADGNWWTQLSKSAEFDLDGSNGKLNSGSAEDTSQNQSQGRDDGAFQVCSSAREPHLPEANSYRHRLLLHQSLAGVKKPVLNLSRLYQPKSLHHLQRKSLARLEELKQPPRRVKSGPVAHRNGIIPEKARLQQKRSHQ